MPIQQRARSDIQKEERRQAILDAAAMMFCEMAYQEITMAAVAQRASLAKGTLYLYFATKEELFLAVQANLLWAWFDEVDAALRQSRRSRPAEIARIFRAALDRRPELVRLLALLQSVLEQNVAFDAALAFKRELRERVLKTGALLESCVRWLAPGDGALVLLRIHALAIGIHHLAEPAPVTRRVLDEPGMELFIVDFAPAFERVLRDMLRGMKDEG